MERIRRAVEQARKARAENADQSSVVDPRREPVLDDIVGEKQPDHGVVAAETAPAEVSNPIVDTHDRPDFTETRAVQVSTAVRERNRLVASIPGHPLVDTYKMMRTRIIQEMETNNWKVIAVTSPATGSGKSLTAINLAIGIGKDLSHTSMLIDADLRRPSIAEYFGYEPEYGINDYLHNNVSLSDCLFRPDMDRLVVLPGRLPISDSAEALGSPKMNELLHEARNQYEDRLIVIDLAPVLHVDDALAILPNVDCMLIVAESGETKREDLAQTLELLQDIPIIGTVLNKVDKKVVESY